MPKPVFREENIHEIARQALFLHEVAHPGISFVLDPPNGEFLMVCDRRQLSQALTNVVKNGVEAIESRKSRGEHSLEGDRVELKLREEDGELVIDINDTGIGLPEDRERLTEPYMISTRRSSGIEGLDRGCGALLPSVIGKYDNMHYVKSHRGQGTSTSHRPSTPQRLSDER